MLAFTFQVDDPHRLVTGGGIHRVGQRVDHGVGEAVAALRPVDP